MKNWKIKSKVTAIVFVLMLSFAATFVALPIVSAHDPPWEIPTYAYAYVRNDVIGVNQEVLIIFWPNAVPPTAVGAYGDRWTWTIEITKPDNSKVTLGPIESDPVGGGYALYTPTEVGTYTIVAKMADHLITGLPVPPGGYFMGFDVYIGDTYRGSSSAPITLTVQEDPIEAWQETPLPEEFWTRPINNMNRDWYKLAGNWLAGAAQNVGPTTRFCYGLGPESAHIMWATPMWAGGIMDERFGNIGYQTGHYEGTDFVPPIILNGRIYYNIMSLPREGYRVLDLYTGEELWFMNSSGPISNVHGAPFDFSGELPTGRLSFGQIYNYESPNQHGGLPYIWSVTGTVWHMYDAETGNYICSINNIPQAMGFFGMGPAGTAVYGKDGSLLQYIIKGTPNPMGPFFPEVAPFYLQVWNSSRAIWYEDVWLSNEYWMWRPTLNMTFDGNNGYSLNVSMPDVQGSIRAVRDGEYVIGGTSGKNNGTYVQDGQLWALSLEKGKEGTLLWEITFTPPEAPPDVATGMFGGMSGPDVDPEDGVFHFSEPITRRRWGYDLETGQQIWGPTEPETALHYYGLMTNVYDGKLYSGGYGGVLTAYNITTGEVMWEFAAQQVGFESPYGNYPIAITAIADGKIYTITGEHSITQPMWRGPNLRCLNATTGEELWKISFFGANGGASLGGTYVAMADGYVVGLNQYDSQIYCFGKGPSKTTVTAAPAIIAEGDYIMIRGTVTDECAGAKNLVDEGKFNTVPAIADEDQEDFMEYLYMQQPCPKDAEGVEVVLETLDPNNNFYEIGRVTSDASGMFKLMWEPPVPGEYTIIATFEGSSAYYRSYAETAIGVTEPPSPAQPIEPEPTEPVPTEPVPTEPVPTEPVPTEPAPTEPEPTDLAIIAAVVVAVVIGVAAYWALRKRK